MADREFGRFGWLVLVLTGCAGDQALPGSDQIPDDWGRADLNTVRLPPDQLPGLSSNVVADLDREGCTIPQSWYTDRPANVVYGRFTDAGQMDVAVLCSVDRVSSIRVYSGGSTTDVAIVNPMPDLGYLQDVGGEIGFSRAIHVARPAFIREQHAVHGGPALPRIEHDGIHDVFVEKASIIHYWHDRKWLELRGTD